jgi:hypothetical protein
VLNDEAAGLALGPVGAIHGSKLELIYSLEADDTADLYSKMRDVAVLLSEHGGIDLFASTARRELALA